MEQKLYARHIEVILFHNYENNQPIINGLTENCTVRTQVV